MNAFFYLTIVITAMLVLCSPVVEGLVDSVEENEDCFIYGHDLSACESGRRYAGNFSSYLRQCLGCPRDSFQPQKNKCPDCIRCSVCREGETIAKCTSQTDTVCNETEVVFQSTSPFSSTAVPSTRKTVHSTSRIPPPITSTLPMQPPINASSEAPRHEKPKKIVYVELVMGIVAVSFLALIIFCCCCVFIVKPDCAISIHGKLRNCFGLPPSTHHPNQAASGPPVNEEEIIHLNPDQQDLPSGAGIELDEVVSDQLSKGHTTQEPSSADSNGNVYSEDLCHAGAASVTVEATEGPEDPFDDADIEADGPNLNNNSMPLILQGSAKDINSLPMELPSGRRSSDSIDTFHTPAYDPDKKFEFPLGPQNQLTTMAEVHEGIGS